MISVKALSIALLLAPLSAWGLILNCPTGDADTGYIARNGPATFTWTIEEGDPTALTFELMNDQTLDSFEFARNTPTSLGSITINMTDVPGNKQYYMQATRPGNVLDVVGTSPLFSVVGRSGHVTWGPQLPTKTGSPITRCHNLVEPSHRGCNALPLVALVLVLGLVFFHMRRRQRRLRAQRIQLPHDSDMIDRKLAV